jgi:hypothetical protein
MDMSDVTKTFVDQYAPMNPETEFLIPTSDLLQNGMVVMIEDVHQRVGQREIDGPIGDLKFDQALEVNRWCTVSHLTHDKKNNLYRFVATYDDGTQRNRIAGAHFGWFVKFDSVDVLKRTRDAVMELIRSAMLVQDAATYHGKGCNSSTAEALAKNTDKILAMFGMGVRK